MPFFLTLCSVAVMVSTRQLSPFAGTNAVFCRQAFDSIGGIQYGPQTEDASTGNVLHTSGWDSVFFREDFEGDAKSRV